MHKHELIYLGRLRGELGGEYPLYQCSSCGATFEHFDGSYAVFFPDMTAHLRDETTSLTFVKDRPRRRPTVLGRGLNDLMKRKDLMSPALKELFNGGLKQT